MDTATTPTFLAKAYFQGNIIPFEDARISVATHALQYGTAAFGGMRGFPNPNNPQEALLFRLKDHALRLSRGAGFLLYDLDPDFIAEKIIQFVQANQPDKPFYLRTFAYNASLGILPLMHFKEKDFLIYGLEMGDYLSPEGISCCFSSWMRPMDASVPLRGKIAGSYVSSCLAKTEALERGFDEALILNQQGKVCEGSAMNLFMVREGRLITPSVDQDILEGITRDSIMTIAKDLGISVIERPVDKSELLIADEVFLSGTAAKLVPVHKIENYRLNKPRPIADQLSKKFAAITQGQEPQYEQWLTHVPYATE